MSDETLTTAPSPTTEVAQARERQVVATFLQLSRSLVADLDAIDFLHVVTERVVELDLATDVGILLVDEVGDLRVLAASQERTRTLELFQAQNREGPCFDCVANGEPVAVDDLASAEQRWPRFAPMAHAAGYRSVQALPLRLRGTVLGALNLFHVGSGGTDADDRVVAQAMADVATIGLLQQRHRRRSEEATGQLQHALGSRIVIEQAKGVVAEQRDLDAHEAFELLRAFARSHNRRLHDLARDVVDGRLAGADLQL